MKHLNSKFKVSLYTNWTIRLPNSIALLSIPVALLYEPSTYGTLDSVPFEVFASASGSYTFHFELPRLNMSNMRLLAGKNLKAIFKHQLTQGRNFI